MGGCMEEFILTEADREHLTAVFKRGRDAGKVQLFLNLAERAAVAWLKTEPWLRAETRPRSKADLEKIRIKAGELLQALQWADEGAAWALFHRLSEAPPHQSQGGTLESVRSVRAHTLATIEGLQDAAAFLADWQAPPVRKAAMNGLLSELAHAYLEVFDELPSESDHGHFREFCAKFANALSAFLPKGFAFDVTRQDVATWRLRELNTPSPLY